MNAIGDIIVSIASGVQIIGNQVTVAVEFVISSFADATPCDGNGSFVCCRADVGGRADVGSFGIAIEYSAGVSVVSSAIWNSTDVPLWIQGTNHKITVAFSCPAPVEVEVIVLIVSVTDKRMSGVRVLSKTPIWDGTFEIQFLFQHFNPKRIGIINGSSIGLVSEYYIR